MGLVGWYLPDTLLRPASRLKGRITPVSINGGPWEKFDPGSQFPKDASSVHFWRRGNCESC